VWQNKQGRTLDATQPDGTGPKGGGEGWSNQTHHSEGKKAQAFDDLKKHMKEVGKKSSAETTRVVKKKNALDGIARNTIC